MTGHGNHPAAQQTSATTAATAMRPSVCPPTRSNAGLDWLSLGVGAFCLVAFIVGEPGWLNSLCLFCAGLNIGMGARGLGFVAPRCSSDIPSSPR